MTEATWTVPADHPAFAGHFPGRPMVPGVLLLDRAILLVGGGAAGLRVAAAKFFSPVGPGETVRFVWQAVPSGTVQVDLSVGERTVASLSLNFPS